MNSIKQPQMHLTSFKTASTVSIGAGSTENVANYGDVIPDGGTFVSGWISNYNTTGMAALVVDANKWYSNLYIALKNVSNSAVSVPKDMLINIMYMTL